MNSKCDTELTIERLDELAQIITVTMYGHLSPSEQNDLLRLIKAEKERIGK